MQLFCTAMAELNPDNYNEFFPQPQLDSAHTRNRFHGKVAIVTGGASGIGRATVERFSNDGAAVAIFDIDETLGVHLENELITQGKKATFYKVDVSNKEECIAAVKKVADDNGEMVNFLANVAAHFCMKPGLELKAEDWNKSMSINVVGYSNMVQACYPYMKKDGKNCAIVNISSLCAHVADPKVSWVYPSTKGAVLILTKCMALDLSEVGIRVNSVSPGPVWTPALWKTCGDRLKVENGVFKNCTLTRKLVDSSGIAAAITFLCSKDASYIDGADLPVDSGYLAMGPEGMGVQSSFAGTSS